jgi:hypothetical protein
MSKKLHAFLSKYEIVPKNEFTHTCLKYKKAYYVAVSIQDEFMEIYKKAYDSDDLSITEKHRDQSPILIDFDFRQNTADKLYNLDHIKQVLKIFLEFLSSIKK